MKTIVEPFNIKNLAIFGNSPLFESPLYVGAPVVETECKQRYFHLMERVFENNYLTNDGPLVKDLEKQLANLHQVKFCAVVCNATIAQILMLKALGLQGEIILPSFTFVSTAHACLWQALAPVFCDIEPDTLMIDPDKLEALITSRTSAVLGVHLFGNLCQVDELSRVCRHHGLKLIFDAAHAFNCSLGEIPVGNYGCAEFISFHATKFFGTFEGGAVLTNDPAIDEKVRFKRNFGFQGYDDVGYLGINGKMSESAAAMGLASLPEIGPRIRRNRKVYDLYRQSIGTVEGVSMIEIGRSGQSNYHYAVMLIDPFRFGVSRDMLCDILWQENIMARKYFQPGCHQMAYYQSRFSAATVDLPVTETIAKQVLCLPTNLPDPENDIRKLFAVFQTVKENSRLINDKYKK